ncbi:hypothetical protein SCLCIDRAFT_1224496 [Scleroderma citrinum Foug A]|uniref:Uncharacterized protein n=1 Tax=Scleroderma citrinum Foug A TaxID=1036808 RepID=A0A0C3D4Y6_9AGAM|nr:hypothetical protein SCLCIDRAFT_1224496 [Scleroderma citrinum Foug A]
MDAREDLPKVSIETEQDWKRIQRNLSDAFFERLDQALELQGHSATDRDELLPHANQFLETLFDIARPNLRINGRSTEELSEVEEDDNIEPFDEALDRHIWSLSDQRLKWDKDIAGRRRTRPKEIEALMSDILAQQDSDEFDVAQSDTSYDHILAKGIYPEMEDTLRNAISLTPRLAQSVSVQCDRATRVQSIADEVKNLKQ